SMSDAAAALFSLVLSGGPQKRWRNISAVPGEVKATHGCAGMRNHNVKMPPVADGSNIRKPFRRTPGEGWKHRPGKLLNLVELWICHSHTDSWLAQANGKSAPLAGA